MSLNLYLPPYPRFGAVSAGRDFVATIRRAGTSAILVTHDRRETMLLADRIAVLLPDEGGEPHSADRHAHDRVPPLRIVIRMAMAMARCARADLPGRIG